MEKRIRYFAVGQTISFRAGDEMAFQMLQNIPNAPMLQRYSLGMDK